MSRTTIDTHVEAWVDRDIATGVLAAEKRAERIGWRRNDYRIGVTRFVSAFDSAIAGPRVYLQVHLQYGSTAVDQSGFTVPTQYELEVRESEPLDDREVGFLHESVAALRRDLAPDLQVDVKGNVLRLNRDLSVA